MATRTLSTSIPELRTKAVTDTSIADPGPLGLSAFALTTFVLSCANAGLIAGPHIVLGLALAYGGFVQILAGMWEFKRNNIFGATAFSSYGAFWISFALLVTQHVALIPEAARGSAIGTFLLAWGIFTTYMTIGAAKVSKPLLVVFVILTVTFYVLAAADFMGSASLHKLGGYLGIATAFAAWYVGAKGLIAAL